jgi:hypothetical protein
MQFLNEKQIGVTPKIETSFPSVLVAHTSRNAAAEERSLLSRSSLLFSSSLLF